MAAPPLINKSLNPPFGTQGRSYRLESVSYKQENGKERLPCPGAPQGLAGFQSLNTYLPRKCRGKNCHPKMCLSVRRIIHF